MFLFLNITGILIILVILWDGFETMVLPRRVTRRFRFARFFYRTTWKTWSFLLNIIPSEKRRETYRALFGPLSLLLLLFTWATGIVVGFSLLYLSNGNTFRVPEGQFGFAEALYVSGTTFFTLGFGDIVPTGGFTRALSVIESGMGLGFLAVLIGHLPSLNNSFSNREVTISLLDARAGSPPTAFGILYRHINDYGMEALGRLLYDMERWCAELLESHLSFPVLAYYRSQHDNQSWLSGLTAVLDVSAFIIAGFPKAWGNQAQLTFAMARHVVVDLAFVFRVPPAMPETDRLSNEDLISLFNFLKLHDIGFKSGEKEEAKLGELRMMYDPYICSLSRYLRLSLPPWVSDIDKQNRDNWQISAWNSIKNQREEGPGGIRKEHF